jgi:hypothetical protein
MKKHMKRFIISEEEKRNILAMYYPNLILENKIYPQKIVNQIIDKFGITSDVDREKLKSKLAIAGLWRNFFGDIFSFKTIDEFNSKFDDWYNNFITKLSKTKNFYNNEDEAKKYLNAYVSNIGSMNDTAQLVSDKTLKDYVEDNNWIQIEQSSIYNPKDEDILYEDNEIIILKGNSKSKCVMYGNGERWCITKPEYNYYNTYRINYKATIYFILQKNVKYPEHKIVMMVYSENKFSIADQTNNDKRTGQPMNSLPWTQIEVELPNLIGKKDYFKYLPPNENEINYQNVLKQHILSDNLQQEINKRIIYFSEITASDFIRDYVTHNHKISLEQLNSLDEEVMTSLIEAGFFSTHYVELDKLNNLTQPQKHRILKLKFYHNPTKNLYDSFSENFKKSLIITLTEEKLEEIIFFKSFQDNSFLNDIIKYYDKDKLFGNKELVMLLIRNVDNFSTKVLKNYGDKVFNDLDILESVIDNIQDISDDFIEKIINKVGIDKLTFNLKLSLLSKSSNPIKIYNLFNSEKFNQDFLGYNLSDLAYNVSFSKSPINTFNILYNQFIKNNPNLTQEDLIKQKRSFDKNLRLFLTDNIEKDKLRQILLIMDKKFVKDNIIDDSDQKKELINYLRTIFSDEEMINFGWVRGF